MRALVVTIFVLTAVLLVACARSDELEPPPPAEPPAPEQASDEVGLQGAWLLISGEHNELPLAFPTRGRITLVLAEYSASGVVVCETYGSLPTVAGSRFQVRSLTLVADPAITGSKCGRSISDTPTRYFLEVSPPYFAALSDINHFELSGERLLLRGPTSELKFERIPPLPTADLVDRRWTLNNLNGEPLSSGVDVQVMLNSDGTFALETGCRDLAGLWFERGDEIRLTSERVERERGDCSVTLETQEVRVRRVIGAFRVELSDDRLTLISRFGETLSYRAAQ